MDWHDVMVLVDLAPPCDRRLKVSALLGRKYQWKITGVGVAPWDEALTSPVMDPASPVAREASATDMFAAEAAEAAAAAPQRDAVLDLAEESFRTATEHLQVVWREYAHGDVAGITRLARMTDLTILGQTDPSEGQLPWGFAPEDILLGMGGPSLIVPYAGDFPTVGDRIVIAWDGSREAARALRDAKPLLADAKKIFVVAVDMPERVSDRAAPTVNEVVAHLESQGIDAWGGDAIGSGMRVADVLLNAVADLSADLLVTGAFHHSRLRERVFGGVTNDLLHHMTVPVLASH